MRVGYRRVTLPSGSCGELGYTSGEAGISRAAHEIDVSLRAKYFMGLRRDCCDLRLLMF